MPDPSNDERIEELEADALLKDALIAELVRDIDNLHAKAEHASVIEQAKGVIMSKLHCGPEAAFAALVAQSQRENRKLWEIAVELAAAQAHPDQESN